MKRHLPPRWRLTAAAVFAAAALLPAVYARDTWAEAGPRDPAGVDDDPVCQVLCDPGGGRYVRSAVRLAHPLEEVWAVVTDYEGYGDLCACLHAADVRPDPAGPTRIEAAAATGLGGFIPFAVEMRHDRGLFEYASSWDRPSADVPVNRGGWVLRPAGPRETLAELRLEVEVRGVPSFLLRNISRRRLPGVLLALRRRLQHGPSGKAW